MWKLLTGILLCLLVFTETAGAQMAPKLQALTAVDRQFMDEQRDRVDELSRRGLGRQINGNRENDLSVLQQLLDRRLVRPDQALELQAMGIVLGDLLAQDAAVEWVVYIDEKGRSRALQMGDSNEVLFPVTMISRRVEAGAEVDVAAIYEKADRLIQPYRRPLPFR